MGEDYWFEQEIDERPPDRRETEARAALERFFDANREAVFFSRQVEVIHEATWYHWVTNRSLRDLIASKVVQSEVRALATGGTVHLMWHRGHRYFRRDAQRVVRLVEEYADPNIGAAIGIQGELLVLEGFARQQFVMRGRNTNAFGEMKWVETEHDLDFIFERDGIAYGLEVKNTLGYMSHEELEVKVRMCAALGLKPLFVARMLPKSWINEVVAAGGFALILKYQLYPVTHRELAQRVQRELKLPVDAPRALNDGTVGRFVRWHERNL